MTLVLNIVEILESLGLTMKAFQIHHFGPILLERRFFLERTQIV
jgi:hypothetical protein